MGYSPVKIGIYLLTGILSAPKLSLSANFHSFDPMDTTNVPKLLSQTGVYINTTAKVLDSAAKYFEVNAPLWSDESAKSRWIILPPGKQIPYDDSEDFFNYPESTVFVKTFKLDKIQGDSTPNTSRVYWETRLLIKKTDSVNHLDWHGFSYKWRADQSDADLVHLENGFDTVFYFTDNEKKTTYKKWHFPSQQECNRCHPWGAGRNPFGGTSPYYARGVLGFYPAQLKRPSPLSANTNQVVDLFNKGVFSGTKPSVADLARRFRGIQEPIDEKLSPADRFATLDTMARSYIAANCSGCHGYRGLAAYRSGQANINLDFYDFKTHMEFTKEPVRQVALTDTSSFDTTGYGPPAGRNLELSALSQWNFTTSPGQIWDMSLPSGDPASFPSVFVYPGYPALSVFLCRMWARNSTPMDSGVVARMLNFNLKHGDSVAASERKGWIFSKAWGTEAWVNTVAQHGFTVTQILKPTDIKSTNLVYNSFRSHGDQMPPLGSYVPDTAAIKVLGEWARNYRILRPVQVDDVIAPSFKSVKRVTFLSPTIRNHTLFVPKTWEGAATLVDIQGRTLRLVLMEKGSYALPSDLPNGVYVFKVGQHVFRKFFIG